MVPAKVIRSYFTGFAVLSHIQLIGIRVENLPCADATKWGQAFDLGHLKFVA